MQRQLMRSLMLARPSAASACLPSSLRMSTTVAQTTKAGKPKKVKPVRQNDPYLQQINADYAKMTAESVNVHNGIKEHFAENSVWTHPIVCKSAQGARFTDVDGNQYIDFVCGFGSALMGHNNEIFQKVCKDMASDNSYHVGTRPPVLKEAVDLVYQATGMDKSYFFESGTKACHLALRVARAHRQKDPVVLFNFGWHGQSDSTLFMGDADGNTVPMSPGIPADTGKHVRMYQYGSEEGLQALRDSGDEIAAVMLEPIPLKFAEASSKEYLQALRDIADEKGFILIFDEVVSGFRVAVGGAQEYYGVKPDMAVYGKGISSNIPCGVLTGKEDIMKTIGTIAVGGTFCSNVMQLSAVKHTIGYLLENKDTVYPNLRNNMARYANAVNEACTTMGIPMKVNTFESIMRMEFEAKFQTKCLHVILAFILALRMRGIYHLTFLPYGFASLAHTPEVMDEASKIVVDTLTDFHNAGMFRGVA